MAMLVAEGYPLCWNGVSHWHVHSEDMCSSRAVLNPSEKILPALVRASLNWGHVQMKWVMVSKWWWPQRRHHQHQEEVGLDGELERDGLGQQFDVAAKTYHGLRQRYVWPHQKHHVEQYCLSCDACQQTQVGYTPTTSCT
eukprot:1415854-Rhodomonas_salina.2